jgi:hypothetical protein
MGMKYERTHFQRLRIGDRFRFPAALGGGISASYRKTSKEAASGPDGDVRVLMTEPVMKVSSPRK